MADHDPYQEFLEKKHSSFEAPGELVEAVVKKATGSEPIGRKRIIAGEVNEVYDVATKDKQNVIVRISRSGSSSFEAEEKAIRLALMAGVPAPKVLLIEEMPSDPENLTFCVEEKIEGEPLITLMNSLDKSALRSLLSEAGGILSKIHSIAVEGFGSLDRISSYKTWGDYIFSMEDERDKIVKAGKVVGVDSSLINEAFKLLRKNEKVFELKEAKLLHGDFSPKHLLVKKDHIVGVLDFENAKGGDPVRDLAWVSYFYQYAFPLDWVKEGYANKSLFDNKFDLKMKLYRLHMGLGFINYYESEKNESGMRYTKDRFIKELEDF